MKPVKQQDQSNLKWVADFIWNIADDRLRDVYVRGKYRDVILPFTVLRRLDAVLESTKQAVLERKKFLDTHKVAEQDGALRMAAGQAFYNTSEFTLEKLKASSAGQRLRDDFIDYLDGFSPNVQEILTKFKFRDQIQTLVDAHVLGYLIQHSAGSGKSNTIAWLAHQLVELKTSADAMLAQFDSVIVITDRRALDTQIARTIKSYDHVASIFGHSEDAAELRTFLRKGKKIIVTTVQKFPFILDELGDLGDKKFALLIDEAHSSQGGKTTAKMHMALSGAAGDDEDDDESVEDAVNKLIESRKMLPNASYFAFTATPKNRTLELFGERYMEGGEARYRSPEELTYTTKQAIQEGCLQGFVDAAAGYVVDDCLFKLIAH